MLKTFGAEHLFLRLCQEVARILSSAMEDDHDYLFLLPS
jgi:hypothetical protein